MWNLPLYTSILTTLILSAVARPDQATESIAVTPNSNPVTEDADISPDINEVLDLIVQNSTGPLLVPEPRNSEFYVDNKVYHVFLVRLNWLSAAEYCASRDLVLASIDSNEDNLRLARKLAQSGYAFNGMRFWLGASDLGHVGQWSWLSNGQPLGYNSLSRAPLNSFRQEEHCLEVESNGVWTPSVCDQPHFVICQNRCPLTSYDVPIYVRK